MVLTYVDGTKQALITGKYDWETETSFWELPVCGNFIGLRCNFDKSLSNVINKLGACEIYDDLPMNYYTIFSKITSFTYYVSDPGI